MPHPLGIESRTVAGMGPVEHIRLAAELGCTRVSLGLEQVPGSESGYPAWSLREDAGLRREVKAALADNGICIKLGEGLAASDMVAPAARAADFDLYAELGAKRLGAHDNGLERERARDQLAELATMARDRGMDLSIIFAPVLTTRSLPEALTLVREIGEDKASLTIDALYFFRTGGSVRQIAELDSALVGHVRICDGAFGDGKKDTQSPRLIPGQGELPLREFVDALPRGKTLGIDVTLPQAAIGYEAAKDYVGEIVARTRALLV
ncbi:sugar phosphate isomerase/epimerase [Novosphingobium sp. PhB165]|uniref:sugar phosphate isomerase/epimerase family protein n=1 Tax=Novosphingobium sp. PhB165 TaxID=2485105 RepID=UPI001043F15D|nr:TIM barrel protein [Novosphingobium sp. PhB165]TCM19004.1 sugar phosphate isomerase/epimerase [Novosphingobium sp. PhB165]